MFSINFHSTFYMEYHYADVYITILQELERQAMEQYRNGNTGDEKRSMDQDCVDGQRCSEYGHCSPVKRHARRKGMTFPKLLYNISDVTCLIFDKNNILNNYLSGSCFPQITLLKPKGKSLPNVCHGNDSNLQATIASRSLTALTDESSKESKNICKGASGDKIDTSGKLGISNVTLRKSIRESRRKFIMYNEISRIMPILDKYLDVFYCYIKLY